MRQTELHLVGDIPGGMLAAPHREAAGGMASAALRGIREETRQAGDGGTETESGGGMEKNAASIAFVIPGVPVGKGRPKFARRGNFVSTYTPEKTASYENLVKMAAAKAMAGRDVIAGAVCVGIHLFVTPPASWSQKKQREAVAGGRGIYPTSKPDVDNVIKGIFDAMNEIVWKDDKQVVDVVVSKRYCTSARAVVEVVPL